MYGKVFDSIYDGTLYGHWEAIVTMQQLIVLANADGVIDMTPHAMAARTSIPLNIIQSGLEFLAKPDPYSRTPGDEGRRIVLLDDHRPWGWKLVNHGKYKRLRDMEQKREADRVRIAEKRTQNNDVAIESQPVANVAHAYADANADTKNKSSRAIALPEWLPLEAWQAWMEVRKRMKVPNTDRAIKLHIETLTKLKGQGQDAARVLDEATKRGWRALYPLNDVSPSSARKVCAYCGEPAFGSANGYQHCGAHQQKALYNEEPPRRVAI